MNLTNTLFSLMAWRYEELARSWGVQRTLIACLGGFSKPRRILDDLFSGRVVIGGRNCWSDTIGRQAHLKLSPPRRSGQLESLLSIGKNSETVPTVVRRTFMILSSRED